MDRHREARRASIVGSNGFNRRRHRTNSLRDSPDDDGAVEFQESARLRERVKKDRDRERERDRERDRDRDRDRERDLRERSSRNKRRRAERLASNRDDTGGDDTSDESVNDEEEDDDDEQITAAGGGSGVRLLSPAVGSISSHQQPHGNLSNHHHSHTSSLSQQQHNHSNSSNNFINSNHHLQHRKTFPPSSSSSKIFKVPPVWKTTDEMISASVPRKARSACTKRSHDWISSTSNNNSGGGGGGEQILLQPSSSPVRQGLVLTSTSSPARPMSPSSSNASNRKKLKTGLNHSGPKLKPPKSSPKPSSSNPEELEIEIAEVLYGLMTQSQGPSSKKEESRDVNRSSSDAKSRNSSPVSNANSSNNPVAGPNSSPLSAVAPKRKRPRQVPENYGAARSSPAAAKMDAGQNPRNEISSSNLDKYSGSMAENGYNEVGGTLVSSQGHSRRPQELTPPEPSKPDPEFKPVAEELKKSSNLVAKEESDEKASPAVGIDESNQVDSGAATTITRNSEMENPKEERFEIDLMAPPPQSRSSPAREANIDTPAASSEKNPASSILDSESMPLSRNGDDKGKNVNDKNLPTMAGEEKKGKGKIEEAESHKTIENKRKNIDLQFDVAKPESDEKLQQQNQKQQQQQMPVTEKSGQLTPSSLPLPVPVASWPGALPPMGYMAPLQGVVSMDGTSVTPSPIQPLPSQPRLKRCATHAHIARNIHLLQQFMKLNPFWPAAAGSASLFGSKPCGVNFLPAGDLNGSIAVRGVGNALDKGQSPAGIPNHGGKEKCLQPAGTSDSAPRKHQIIMQQALPPVPPSNLLGPAFIFPLNQQQAAVSARPPSAAKSPNNGGGVASSSTASSAGASASSAAGSLATAMSFNYPNMAASETQYLAILQNNAYPFPIAAPNYRGGPSQAMPLFNGSFYSSQMIHPSQLQHQQPPSSQPQPSGSSSSQKHLQGQIPRPPQSSSATGAPGGTSFPNFSNQKSHPSRPTHLESEMGSEDGTSASNRGSRATVNMYGQNFAMPIHPQNFAFMTAPGALTAAAAAAAGSGNQSEKKTHQPQSPGLKTGVDSMAPHSFAMSFGPINGTTAGPGIDMASLPQNHAIFQNSPEATRQNIQMMAAAAAAHAQKKNFRISDDGKSGGGDSFSTDDERKSSLKSQVGGLGQSIVFARSDSLDTPVIPIQANAGIENSARTINVASGATRNSRPVSANVMGSMNVPNAHIQAQFQQQQMLQLKQQHQHQQAATATNRNKVPVTSNGSIYPEHLTSSSTMAAKFPNALSGFPQNFVQSNSSSPAQSPQRKSSTTTRPPTSQASSASTAAAMKNGHQQHSRTPNHMHTQISFGGNQKPSTTSQGQASLGSNQASSPPMMVASPPTSSSMSKGAAGSPRTGVSSSTSNKMSQAPSFTVQNPKNSQSIPSQKTPSILGNPNMNSSSSAGARAQMQQQSQQQQVQKTMQQQAQLFFSNPYSQAQAAPHSTGVNSSTSGPGGYYMQRRKPEQHQQSPGGPTTSSTGVLSLCPSATMVSTGTTDPAKAIAAATSNVKGGALPSQSIIHASQFAGQSSGTLLPAGFSYVHPVPAAVQVKPAEQKQPAGNDNLHPWQPEKK